MASPTHDEIGRDLAERIARGDTQAESELVARYRPGLLVLLRHRLAAAAEAEDLCQETLRIAIESLRAGRLIDSEKLSSYLWGIASRLSFRTRERRDREVPASDAVYERPDSLPGPNESVLALERGRLVRAALMGLAPRDRAVLCGYYLKELDKGEICRHLGLSSSQFDVIKFRALRRLARLWRRP